MPIVQMTCMTTKQKFDCENPPVVVLSNGRYAFRVKCPWEGKQGKELFAFKFCSSDAYRNFMEMSTEKVESTEDQED